MEYILNKMKEIFKTNSIKTNVSGKEEVVIRVTDLTKMFNTIHNDIISSKKNYENEISALEVRCQLVEKDNQKHWGTVRDLTSENRILKESLETSISTPKNQADFRLTLSYYEDKLKEKEVKIGDLTKELEMLRQVETDLNGIINDQSEKD